MTDDEIIGMAREADIDWHKQWNDDGSNRLAVFATLVAARGRKQVYTSILRGLRSENDSPQLRAIIASVEADCARADNEVTK